MKILTNLHEKSPTLFWAVFWIIYGAISILGLVVTFALGKFLYELIFP